MVMRFNRELWEHEPLAVLPSWPCPTCHQGTLSGKPSAWTSVETAGSAAARRENPNDWEPDWEELRAVGFLHCTKCDEPVAVIAEVKMVRGFDEQEGPVWEPGYRPHTLLPSPHMVELPASASKDVQGAMTRAFSLYWSDPSASGSCIRTAIEALLDQLGVSRSRVKTKKDGTRFRDRRGLHDRLQEIAPRLPSLEKTLMALKWLGNAGTHDVLTHGDVLQAMDLLDHAFDEIYHKRSKRLAQTAKAIIRRRGPIRHRAK